MFFGENGAHRTRRPCRCSFGDRDTGGTALNDVPPGSRKKDFPANWEKTTKSDIMIPSL